MGLVTLPAQYRSAPVDSARLGQTQWLTLIAALQPRQAHKHVSLRVLCALFLRECVRASSTNSTRTSLVLVVLVLLVRSGACITIAPALCSQDTMTNTHPFRPQATSSWGTNPRAQRRATAGH